MSSDNSDRREGGVKAMGPSGLTFFGGLLMGLASSLHCAGMCGAIASSMMLTLEPRGGPRARARALLAAQAGRVAAYVASGAFLGGVGGIFYGAFDHSDAYLALRWTSTVALGWIGLSIAGFAPSLAGLDRVTAPVGRAAVWLGWPAAASGAGAFAAGIAWGFLPCGMVYGALFYAMLSGGWLAGGVAMLGFGLGAAPAVTAAAFGVSRLREFARIEKARVAVGVAIAALAAISALVPVMAASVFCSP
jgi:sulfite exporter TauE/SafE